MGRQRRKDLRCRFGCCRVPDSSRSATNLSVTIVWNAESGTDYQLVATRSVGIDNGTAIVWTAVGLIVTGAAHSMSDANPSAAQRYYRFLVP